MSKTNRGNQRGSKQHVDVNPNPGASEENGTGNEQVKTEQPAQSAQKPRRDRHPVFDRFFNERRYDQQVVALTMVMDGPEAAAQVRADLLMQRAERIMKEDGRLNNRGLQREVRLSELATELKAGQRKMTFDEYGLKAEDEEEFVLRLIATAKDIPDGPGMGMIRKELDRLLGEVRDHNAWLDEQDRRRAQQSAGKGDLAHEDKDQQTTLGDALKLTGTAG